MALAVIRRLSLGLLSNGIHKNNPGGVQAPARSFHAMKIAVVGCGAVGGFYGARLARAGPEVHFLLRSDYEQVRQHGVRILSRDGDFVVRPFCARRPSEIGSSDLVVIGLKTTANDQLTLLLPPLIHSATAILTLQNGLGNEEQLARLFPQTRILGGLCFVCLNRVAPGVIRHLDHGRIVLGEYSGSSSSRARELVELFQRAGVPCEPTEDLVRAHWEKLIWNIPFNGLGVASAAGYEALLSGTFNGFSGPCLTTDLLLKDARWEQLARELMAEVIAGARARGLAVAPSLAERQIAATRSMGAYKPSTLIDYEQGLPLELESLFLEPLRQIQETGVPAPRLAALCQLLASLPQAPDASCVV